MTEQCGGSLKTYLVEHSGNNPEDNSMTVENVPRWAQQIVDALSVIHGTFQGCVHGDLRLENVLVSRGNFFFFVFFFLVVPQNLVLIKEIKPGES